LRLLSLFNVSLDAKLMNTAAEKTRGSLFDDDWAWRNSWPVCFEPAAHGGINLKPPVSVESVLWIPDEAESSSWCNTAMGKISASSSQVGHLPFPTIPVDE
jgi:hypothetical protein